MADNVNHPPHYTRGGIETIDFIEAKELSWCLGNVVKYVSRAGHKGDKLEDLGKAAWYLRREIEWLGGDVNNDESQSIRQRDEQIAKLAAENLAALAQRDNARKEAEKWKTENMESQAEIRKVKIECDQIRQAAKLERRDLLASLEHSGTERVKAINERDEARNQIAELTQRLNDAYKAAATWTPIASRIQGERDSAIAERDEARQDLDAARKQIAELTWQCEAERKQADEWNASACKLQAELDEARKQFAELTRQRNIGVSRPPDGWYDAACQMADQRDEARRQVVELTKQLVAAGLLQPTETEQCHG